VQPTFADGPNPAPFGCTSIPVYSQPPTGGPPGPLVGYQSVFMTCGSGAVADLPGGGPRIDHFVRQAGDAPSAACTQDRPHRCVTYGAAACTSTASHTSAWPGLEPARFAG
jgi:hypothetical protein